ncbi:MAG TPA: bifunctional phosphoribosylaminoimidazolecarboxamide formyltransferase/IMP cyclohydrolase [Planctomycetota bacterium]|nr:bifunctional phosphoribosylaminoimidazolecarboxamide formyltransferase/IMP cyclohydrolase [Planctomycetota bacterium]
MTAPRIERALLSVHDKRGIVDFARALASLRVEILSTGGTRRALAEAGLSVREVAEVTGFPEMLGGRVKTLHPKIHAGILARRDLPAHRAALEAQGIAGIDLVAVNLYPFEGTVARPGVARDEAIEEIDVGGPTLLRAAAKNHDFVAAVVDPDDYPAVLEELRARGALSPETRRRLASKAFRATAAYDAAIAVWLSREEEERFPESAAFAGRRIARLRYGENPHQAAALYRSVLAPEPGVAGGEVLGGKALSFNNLLDIDAAFALVREFSGPTAAVVKHNNPSGAACAAKPADALAAAWEGDPVSAFGSVVGLNRPFDAACAGFLASESRFVEAILAPDFEPAALETVTTKPKWGRNVRLVRTPFDRPPSSRVEVRSISGGFLLQTTDDRVESAADLKVATKRSPTLAEVDALLFAATVAKHVRSNAVVLSRDRAVVGVGAGQMSRVDAVRLAIGKAGARARGVVLASDAFFPFADGVEEALAAGVTAILQPGGSVRDAETIAAADRAGAAMVFTGVRHFRH